MQIATKWIVRLVGACAVMLASGNPGAYAQSCAVPLAKFGPIDPVHGFPQYYQDSNGLALEPCLSVACNPAFALPNPTQPLSFPGNFPTEWFYHLALSDMTTPAGGKARLTLALEGSFLNGTPVPGQQITFSRVRIRVPTLVPNATYTVTHPYGVESLTADSTGVINFTRDSLRSPGVFGPALTGDVGPFLTFLAGTVPPAPRQIGSVASQSVQGSPCSHNFFRIQGPGMPGGGLQTDQFTTLVGEIAPICGNGVLDLGEQCDDGNTLNGDCCSSTCQLDPAGTACDDGNVCTANANGCNATGGCPVTGFTTVACNDGNACTTADTCAGGVCVGGPPPNCNDSNACTTDSCAPATGCVHTTISCDDGNICTTDTCSPATGCVHTNNTLACNDGNACTTNDTCSGGTCVGGPAPNCSDGNGCTDDSCNPATGCVHTNNTAPCNDGNACTTADTCSGGTCVGGPAPNCNDNNVCTADSCAPATGCQHTNVPGSCDDGNACTTNDACSAGVCVGGPPLNCNDNNVCTNDSCNVATGCVHTNNTGSCDDGNACTTADTCSGGTCVGGPARNCDDGNPCTDESCNPATGCLHTNNSASCNDGNPCTINDRCSTGVCIGGGALNCDDGNPCTNDACNPATGCTHTNNNASCDDGNLCTTADTCTGGTCVGGAPPNCNDGNPCTDDSCVPGIGCVHTNNTAPCNDGSVCTTVDQCSGGVCVGSAPLDCNDNNVCTDDVCSPTAGCQHLNNSASCDDGNVCTTGDHCSGGTCFGGPPANCSDGNVCTTDGCTPGVGCTHTNNANSCDDGNACTTNDTCSGGTCQGGAPPDCNDGNPCTDDTCNPATGCTHTNNTAPCDDGDVCTTNDQCGGGTCGGGPPLDCDDQNECTADTCASGVGCRHTNTSGPCDDGNACTTNDTCSGGVCLGGSPIDCNDGNLCTTDSCDPSSGCAHVPNTVSCDDGNPCTTVDTCAGGTCVGGGDPLDCDDGNACTDDTCSPSTGCVHTNNTAPCEDGDPSTILDRCAAGTCVPGVLACPATPLTRCRVSFSPRRAKLLISRGSTRARDRFLWKWQNGMATTKEDFGNPLPDGGSSYVVCMYAESATLTPLQMEHGLPAGGVCNGAPCWQDERSGYSYEDRTGSHAPGLVGVSMKGGRDGRASIQVKGAGAGLGLPALPLPQDAKVTVQLIGRPNCWQATYKAPAATNSIDRFADTGD